MTGGDAAPPLGEALVRVDGDIAAGGVPAALEVWWFAVGAGVLVLVVLGWMGVRYGRKTGDAAEDAFLGLCRAVRLRAADRRVVRRLALAIEAKPVAVLLCRSAFRRGVAVSADDAPPPEQQRRIERRLFGDD